MKRNATTTKLGNLYYMANMLEVIYFVDKKPFSEEQIQKIELAWSLIADVYEQQTGEKRRPLRTTHLPTNDGLH